MRRNATAEARVFRGKAFVPVGQAGRHRAYRLRSAQQDDPSAEYQALQLLQAPGPDEGRSQYVGVRAQQRASGPGGALGWNLSSPRGSRNNLKDQHVGIAGRNADPAAEPGRDRSPGCAQVRRRAYGDSDRRDHARSGDGVVGALRRFLDGGGVAGRPGHGRADGAGQLQHEYEPAGRYRRRHQAAGRGQGYESRSWRRAVPLSHRTADAGNAAVQARIHPAGT
ncbi:hypothetical protein [Lysobacter gummosus]|uniref:hypothetical protein n=1 Tax=Lysobacter gummosus TaxID=262324 RepID=UPI003633C2CC